MAQIGQLSGFPDGSNLDTIVVLFLSWLIVRRVFSYSPSSSLSPRSSSNSPPLAGFVLVPFAWRTDPLFGEAGARTIISSGIKILVLAVIVGIGGGYLPNSTCRRGPM